LALEARQTYWKGRHALRLGGDRRPGEFPPRPHELEDHDRAQHCQRVRKQDPHEDSELAEAVNRYLWERYEQVVCVEANDGQYADLAELALRREVKRVPLHGGRISLEAVRDGIERVLSGGPSEPPIPPPPDERVAPSPLGIG
jgi:hypothetical protein